MSGYNGMTTNYENDIVRKCLQYVKGEVPCPEEVQPQFIGPIPPWDALLTSIPRVGSTSLVPLSVTRMVYLQVKKGLLTIDEAMFILVGEEAS